MSQSLNNQIAPKRETEGAVEDTRLILQAVAIGYEVCITSYGDCKLAIIKIVKSLTGLSLTDCKRILDSKEISIGACTSQEDADRAVAKIKSVGGEAYTAELTLVRCIPCRHLIMTRSEGILKACCENCGEKNGRTPILDSSGTTGFEVMLVSWGDDMLTHIGIVSRATGRSPSDSREMVISAPVSLGRTHWKEDALKIVHAIHDAGGQAHIQ